MGGVTTGERGHRRSLVSVTAALAVLAATFGFVAVLGTGASAQQQGPCTVGGGVCAEDGDYTLTRFYTGSGTCDWHYEVDWGDGTSDTYDVTITGADTTRFDHQYAEPGIYVVVVQGTGTPRSAGTSCDFAPETIVVEVPPRGAIICLGRIATIIGTNNGERLTGTSGPDVIDGRGGRDISHSKGGDDRVCAGSGNDVVRTKSGSDLVDGGKGDDIIRTGSGMDFALGGPGSDEMYGGSGMDYLWGNGGRDVIDGGKGDDDLFGNGGKDRLLGRGGDDALDGGAKKDRCIGGPGKDTKRRC